MARQKLNLDMASLFPGEVITIGTTSVTIAPLNITQISALTKQSEAVVEALVADNIVWENFDKDKTVLLKVAMVIADQSPEVLAEVSNIEVEDIKVLPITEIVKIITAVVKVNFKSKDDLIKNFKSLIAMLPQSNTDQGMKVPLGLKKTE